MSKGQVEFIIIVGLLIVVSVVVFYAYQSGLIGKSPVPSNIAEQQRTVKSSLENFIRNAALETIRTLATNGGYLSSDAFELGSVKFNGKDVPYWQKNGVVNYPDIKSNFVKGVTDYLNENREYLSSALGSNITLGEASVSAEFLNDRIILRVNMPTTVKGYPIQQPYIVEVNTKFGKLVDFSTKFVNYATNTRPFEYHTLSTMLLSPMENGVSVIPIYIALMDCGSYVFKSWNDVKPELEHAIAVTLAQTYMPGKAPVNMLKKSGYPKYTLTSIDGNTYSDIDVKFYLPDDFELTRETFKMTPDPISAFAKPVPFAGVCVSDPVYVNYYLTYPVVVRASDGTSNLQFAFQVYINNNQPGDWSTITTVETDTHAMLCSNPSCYVDMTVKSSSGQPISMASVSFMNCPLGVTDENGRIAGPAPCGAGKLEIIKNGYGAYKEMKTSDELTGEVTLYKRPTVNFVPYEVSVQEWSDGKHVIYYGEDYIRPVTDKMVYLAFYPKENPFKDRVLPIEVYLDSSGTTTDVLPAGEYMASGYLMSQDFTTMYGGFVADVVIEEDMDGKDVYVYIPVSPEFEELTNQTEIGEKMIELTNVLYECGILPVSETPYEQEEMCVV